MRTVDQKLGLRDGMSLLVMNQPRAGMLGQLPSLPVIDREPQDRIPVYDSIIIFAKSRAELEPLVDTAIPRYKRGGHFWVCYPKTASRIRGDLNRNSLWNAVEGFRPVANVAVDDDWSAIRYRYPDEVNT